MSEKYKQLNLDFYSLIRDAKAFSRDQVMSNYNPVEKTLAYMQKIVDAERDWETTIKTTREQLLKIDPRELYVNFLLSLQQQIESDSSKAPRLAHLLEKVFIRGFGMNKSQIQIEKPLKGGTKWKIIINLGSVTNHIANHIVGKSFLNILKADQSVWNNTIPRIAASDVSQHCNSVPIPAHFFKQKVPFILNNAAGRLLTHQNNQWKYDNLFHPKPDEDLLRWMLIDPSYQEELESEDYKRCLASAMDVGQYTFDHQFLFNLDQRTPNIIFRDGTIFPQDAYIDNFLITNRRGEFTRTAIKELLKCLNCSRDYGILYAGVSKNVQLQVYSAVLDWYIHTYVDQRWDFGNYTFTDGYAMTLLLSTPDFIASNLSEVITTCLIKRSFTTRANLNTKASDLDLYLSKYENDSERNPDEIIITPYRQLCQIGHLYMFFIGHSKTPEQRLPRYEFFYDSSFGSVEEISKKILCSLQNCSLELDKDHSFIEDEEITYILPTVTQEAHNLSKDVAKCISEQTESLIMSRYKAILDQLDKD